VEHIGTREVSVLDLCAGSGAIGLAVLKYCPNAMVSFGELNKRHREEIKNSLEANGLDAARATIRSGDLFEPFGGARFNIIATNPPYIPDRRELDESVVDYEPPEALYGGPDGLSVIRKIAEETPDHIHPGGELWMECDIENIEEAKSLLPKGKLLTDPFGRPRLLVAYY
jgi:HemK-like putative methylase